MDSKFNMWWQTSRLHSWWLKIKQHPFVTMGIIVLLIAFLAFALAAYWLGWDWTGFTGYSPPTQQYQRGKTLWDWLQLLGVLAVPVVVGFGAVWFTAQQGEASKKENTDNQREIAYQAYLDHMSDLLLKEPFNELKPAADVCSMGRARTLAVLRRLDGERKGCLILFLSESNLYKFIELNYADLSGSDLRSIRLREEKLCGVNLRNASLSGADLSGADLSGAIGVTVEELEKQAKSLKDATMPDGSKHP